MPKLTSHPRRRGWLPNVLFTVLVFLVGTGVVALLWRGPWWFDGKFLKGADYESAAGPLITSFRASVTQLLLGLGGVVALWFTWRNYRLSRRGQVTDRFIKALERLGSSELYVRYGGVLALEQIVQDDPEQAAHATQVLVAFVRDRAPTCRHPDQEPFLGRCPPLPDEPDADVQAALTALTRPASRRHVDRAVAPLDLRNRHLAGARLDGADLRGVDLAGANLRDASLKHANLSGACLVGADLSGANLVGADLSNTALAVANLSNAALMGANLRGARLDHANLRYAVLLAADLCETALYHADLCNARLGLAKLRNARVDGANLQDANLDEANLRGAILDEASLTGARLLTADLTGAGLVGADLTAAELYHTKLSDASLDAADLSDANLAGADLTGATLDYADLSRTLGLNADQLVAARPDTTTQLPADMATDPRVVERIRQVTDASAGQSGRCVEK